MGQRQTGHSTQNDDVEIALTHEDESGGEATLVKRLVQTSGMNFPTFKVLGLRVGAV